MIVGEMLTVRAFRIKEENNDSHRHYSGLQPATFHISSYIKMIQKELTTMSN